MQSRLRYVAIGATLGLGLVAGSLWPALHRAEASVPVVESTEDAQALATLRGLAIQTRVAEGRWKSGQAVQIRADERLELRVKRPPEASSVRWFLVFADLTRPYNNAHPPGTPKAYSWKGYEPIDYYRIELTRLRDQWTTRPFEDAGPLHAGVRAWLEDQGLGSRAEFYHDDLGTFRFQAIVTTPSRTLRTPGVEDVRKVGISADVLRVTVRSGDDLLGHLRSFFNVPGVFGSTTKQATGHIGVDCADVLMAAYGEDRGRKQKKNYNVASLVRRSNPVAKIEWNDSTTEKLAWGKTVRPGDFIAVRYPFARIFQHIGALEADADGDGFLSPGDRVLHAGPWPLHSSLMDSGMFHGEIVIFRPKASW